VALSCVSDATKMAYGFWGTGSRLARTGALGQFVSAVCRKLLVIKGMNLQRTSLQNTRRSVLSNVNSARKESGWNQVNLHGHNGSAVP